MTLPLSLSREERIDWLRLIRSENVEPITFFALLGHFGTVGEALAGVPGMARRGGNRKAIRICPRADAERECAAVEAAAPRFSPAARPATHRSLPTLRTRRH
jgi:DNA processing protein